MSYITRKRVRTRSEKASNEVPKTLSDALEIIRIQREDLQEQYDHVRHLEQTLEDFKSRYRPFIRGFELFMQRNNQLSSPSIKGNAILVTTTMFLSNIDQEPYTQSETVFGSNITCSTKQET